MKNQRFANAVMMLAALAAHPEILLTSDELSVKIGANSVVLRRLIQQLGQAELVLTQRGPNGGCTLARDASEITLAQIYRAVEGAVFVRGTSERKLNRDTRATERELDELVRRAQRKGTDAMGTLTLADLV
jgi:Rrf2 family protein